MHARVIDDGEGRTATLLFPHTESEYRHAHALCLDETGKTDSSRWVIVTTQEQRNDWGAGEQESDAAAETTPLNAVKALSTGRAPQPPLQVMPVPDQTPKGARQLAAEPLELPAAAPLPAATAKAASPSSGNAGNQTPVEDDTVAKSVATVHALSTTGGALAALGGATRDERLREEARRRTDALAHDAQKAVQWWERATRLPVTERGPETFSRAALDNELDKRIWVPRQVRDALADALEACMQHRGKLYVEEPGNRAAARVGVRRHKPLNAPAGILISGPSGTAKGELATAAALSLHRPWTAEVVSDWTWSRTWKGEADDEVGAVVGALLDTKVLNPAFVVHNADKGKEEVIETIASAIRPNQSERFEDRAIGIRWNASEILWILTADHDEKLPENLRDHLQTVRTRPYTEEEKVSIAERHAARGRGAREITSASEVLESQTPPGRYGGYRNQLTRRVRWEGQISSTADAEAVRNAADKSVQIECTLSREAALDIIRSHTDEPGATELCRKVDELAAACAANTLLTGVRPPDKQILIKREDVLRHLGRGTADTLPEAVVEAIAAEKTRGESGDQKDHERIDRSWIDWLENVPWKSPPPPWVPAATLLDRLDRSHTGMRNAKRQIAEHLDAQRNGANNSVLCLAGPPGVGKTSLAQAVAAAAERPLVRLACGGWRDETDLRGHNRTWRDAQPGWIMRELRRAGCRWPIFVLDEIDKIGANPASVLLEVLDPAQRHQFRDAFIDLPFDLSEVIFITTANEPGLIQPALHDRLDIVPIAGYSDDEKIEIGIRHILPQAAAEAGLPATAEVVTTAACRCIVARYTHEQGVRQLARHLRTLCRRWATKRRSDLPIDAEEIADWLGPPREDEEDTSGTLDKAVSEARLGPAAMKAARRGLRVMESEYAGEAERNRARTYVETLTSMAWPPVEPAGAVRADEIRKALDEKFVGQTNAKTTIAEWAAEPTGGRERALCLAGRAGTGKSAMATEVAAILGLQTAVVDCRTIERAGDVEGREMNGPGKIVQALKEAGATSALLLLEHVDELQNPEAAAAVAAMLATRHKGSFTDRYLQVGIELGNFPLLATVRDAEQIPPAVQKTMEVVELYGYTNDEKFLIAWNKMRPLIAESRGRVEVSEIAPLIYAERDRAGVGTLKARLESLRSPGTDRHGNSEWEPEDTEDTERRAGRAIGLALDNLGGEPLIIDAAAGAGSGRLTLTGRQTREMREAVRTARQWLKDRSKAFGLEPGWELRTDLHVHIGRLTRITGGTSAGIAIAAALASVMTGQMVRAGVALTGEIGLSDHIGEVGGVVDKVIAAARYRIDEVHVPDANRREVENSGAAPARLKIVYADNACATVQEVLEGTATDSARHEAGDEQRLAAVPEPQEP